MTVKTLKQFLALVADTEEVGLTEVDSKYYVVINGIPYRLEVPFIYPSDDDTDVKITRSSGCWTCGSPLEGTVDVEPA